ncbi:hypothetical protein N0V85_008275 [Neurospora sp. IMI 360204]|nr:hypothetical protein N0V85_008275 [Neurospora sp. IMI 360204]
MVTTRHAQSGGRAQETATSNAPFHQGDDDSSSSDDDIPAEPTLNYKRNRSMFTGPTLRPMKRVRNSLEYIHPSKRQKTPESIVVAGDQEEAEGNRQDDHVGEDEDALFRQQLLDVVNSFTKSRDPPLPPTEPQPEPQPSTTGVKRRRGRPRKHPLPVIAQDQPAFKARLSQRALDEIEALAEETLEAGEAQTQERDGVLDSVEVEYHTAFEALEPAEHPESQLPRGVDDHVDNERQQEEEVEQEQDEQQQGKESLQKGKLGQESDNDSDSDQEFPSLFDLKKRTKKQVPPSAQPELGPEHTRPSPVLGSDPADEFPNGDDYQNQQDDYEEMESDEEYEEEEESHEDEEEQTDKEDETNNQPPRAPPNRRTTAPQDWLQVEMPGSTILPLRNIMGRPGWTGLSKDWSKTIIQQKPTATQLVKRFWGQLYDLKILFDRAPRAASLTKQDEYWVSRNIKTLDDIVDVCEQYLAPNVVTKPHDRQSLRQDLFEYGIPMLILVLSSAYCLGEIDGGDYDGEYDFPGFPQFGTFTTSTIQYLLRITDWIKRLGTRLVSEVSDDEDRKVTENRQLLKKLLGPWGETLKQALSDLDDKKIAKDEAIKRDRQAAEQAELAKRNAQYAAFALSIQRPSPRVGQWQYTNGSMAMPRSSGVVAPVRSVPTPHQQQPVSATSSRQPRVSSTGSTYSWQRRSYKPNYPMWSDEKKKSLEDHLRMIGPEFTDMDYEELADALRKPISEVRHEALTLRATAKSRAEERGTKVEGWARVDD